MNSAMGSPFKPVLSATKNIDVGAASARVAMTGCSGDQAILVTNDGTATVWINGGDGTVVASAATDIPIRSGCAQVLTFTVPQTGVLDLAAIAAGATGKVYFTPGDGI